MRVALKNISGTDTVDVSLSKGEAVVTLKPANAVKYEQLLRAIEKNGFVVKGSKVVADGSVSASDGVTNLGVSSSNERLKLEPAGANVSAATGLSGKTVEVIGTIPEVPKGKTPEVLRYDSIVEK